MRIKGNLFFFFLFISSFSFAQDLGVSIPNENVDQWLRTEFQGENVNILAGGFIGDPQSLGTFSTGQAINLNEGVILSTGRVLDANDPNEELFQQGSDMSFDHNGSALSGFTSYNIKDENIIELTFIPTRNTIEFEFLFATEEWPIKLCNEMHDVFGMLLQGEGVYGFYEENSQHLGYVSETLIPINIGNVYDEHPSNAETCMARYEEFFETNPVGGPFPYNGYTTVFTGRADVIPHTVYTLRILLGDVGDDRWDTALFFPKGALKSYSNQPLSFDLPDTKYVPSDDCDQIELCLPFNEADWDVLYHLRLDAMQYTGEIEACAYTNHFYDLLNLTIGGTSGGAYELTWTVNGTTHTGMFSILNELKTLMNEMDPQGHWYFDGTHFTAGLNGGLESSTYSALSIKNLINNAQYEIGLNTSTQAGIKIFLDESNTVVSVTDLQTNRLDVMNLDIDCKIPTTNTTEVINLTIPLGEGTSLYCNEFNLGFVPVIGTQNICPLEETDAASFTLLGTGDVINISAFELGSSMACYKFCDDGEINCHTKEINVDVIPNDQHITWNYVPDDVTVDCENIPPPPQDVEASSTCPTGIEVEFYETTLGSCVDDNFVIHREFRASHDCGFGDTIYYRIKVYDGFAPTFSQPFEDLTLSCNDSDFDLKVDQWLEAAGQASDNCGDEVTVEYNFDLENVMYNCSQASSTELFITAKDPCGNRTIRSAFLKTTPIATSSFNLDTLYYDVEIGTSTFVDLANELSFIPIHLTGQCIGTLEMEVIEEPSISIDFTPDELGQSYACLTICSDNFDECVELFILVNGLPIIDGIEFSNEPIDLDATCDDIPPVEQLTAVSNCQTGQVSIDFEEWEEGGTCLGNYVLNRRWIASDPCGNSKTIRQKIYVFDVEGPTFTNAPQDLSLDCNSPKLLDDINVWLNTVEATDECSDVTVTNDFEGYNENCTAPQNIGVTFTATDACSNFTSVTAILSIVPSVDDDFVFTSLPEDLIVSCDGYDPEPLEYPTANSPNCPGQITFSYTDNIETGFCAGSFTVERVWTAIDPCGNGVSASSFIQVQDTEGPYVVLPPTDVTFSCEDPNIMGDVSDWVLSMGYGQYEDTCDGFDLIDEYNFWPIPDCDNLDSVWTQVYQFYPTDQCGNWTEFTATLTIVPDLDLTGIMIDAQLFDLVLQCDDEVPLPLNLSATTDCTISDQVLIEFTETQFTDCGGAYTLERVWNFSDDCGNTEQVSRTIQFVDNFGPSFTAFPEDITIELAAGETVPEFEENSITYEDNCGEVDLLSANDEITSTTNNGYIITRSVTLGDECGNQTVMDQIITVIVADVWPGDTDSSKIVDQFDLFNIGFGFGQTGPARMNPSTDWVGQFAAYWNASAPDGINYRHADTDGNGIIDDNDSLAVSLNWGFEHDFRAEDDSRSESPLSLELINVNDNGWIRIGVMLGDSNQPFEDFYGIAYALEFEMDKIESSSTQIVYEDSWVGLHGAEVLSIAKMFSGKLHSAMVKKNQVGSNGFGKIAEIQCRVKEEYLNQSASLIFKVEIAEGVFADGEVFTVTGDEEMVDLEPNSIENLLEQEISVYPNPAKEKLFYKIDPALKLEKLVLINNAGSETSMEITKKESIDLTGMPKGIYFVKFYTDQGVGVKKVLVQ